MCQSTGTMLGDGERRVDRHVLRNTQRKLKMEAVLGSAGSGGAQGMRTPSPQRKSMLSRSQSYSFDKENNAPGTSPTLPVLSRLSSTPTPGSTTPKSPKGAGSFSFATPSTPTTPPMGFADAKRCPRYTSLSELVVAIPNSTICSSDSFGSGSQGPGAPRTPMKDALVEKAVRAYLQPSESFNVRTQSSGWRMCLVFKQFLPGCMSKLFTIPNPLHAIFCAVHAFNLYMSRPSIPIPMLLLGDEQSEDDRSGLEPRPV